LLKRPERHPPTIDEELKAPIGAFFIFVKIIYFKQGMINLEFLVFRFIED
jgi:hypothetical protein